MAVSQGIKQQTETREEAEEVQGDGGSEGVGRETSSRGFVITYSKGRAARKSRSRDTFPPRRVDGRTNSASVSKYMLQYRTNLEYA